MRLDTHTPMHQAAATYTKSMKEQIRRQTLIVGRLAMEVTLGRHALLRRHHLLIVVGAAHPPLVQSRNATHTHSHE